MFFTFLSVELSWILHFFVCFCKHFTLFSSINNVGALTVIQKSTVAHSSVQIFCTQKCLFFRFVLFWRTKLVSLNFTIKKLPTPQQRSYLPAQNKYNARHTASRVDNFENGGQKKFYVKAKELSSHVTKQTWIWSSSNHITLTWTFATMCFCCSSSIK